MGRRYLVRSFVVAATIAGAIGSLNADGTVLITGGMVDMSPGRFYLSGVNRQFNFQGAGSPSSLIWGPASCNGDPNHCRPGGQLNLLLSGGGNDLPGTATIDGHSFAVGDVHSPNQMNLQFTGSTVLPPLAASATITAPFTVTGTFTHAPDETSTPTQENLTGGGTATITLIPDQGTPGSWHVTHVRYTLSRLPARWQSVEVGEVGTPGYAYQGPDADLFMAGAGANIWDTADSFRFVYQPILDGEISAVVGAETNTDSFAKTGVMIRQSVEPGSPHVILDVKPDGGVEFMTRRTQAGPTSYLAGATVPVQNNESGVSIYATLKLARHDGVITASVCRGTCKLVGSITWGPGPALIGVAVTSRNPSVLNHAYFPADLPTVTTVPAPWYSFDIGPPSQLRGAAFYQNGTFTVIGSGANIWGTSDEFHFVRNCILDDGELVARVASEQNADTFGKAGLMMRDGGATVILDVRPNGLIEFMSRPSTGSEMAFVNGAATAIPTWLKLVRIGDVFSGYIGDDGKTWRLIGSTTVSMQHGTCIDGGLAVTSRDTQAMNTSTFDHVFAASRAFTDIDVGDVGEAGSVSTSPGGIVVNGAGANIWGTLDAFNFYVRGMLGDGQIVVRVDSVQNTDTFAKAGVMIRESTDPSAAHVILDARPNGEIEFMTRPAAGDSTAFIGGATMTFPAWLKLTRSGSLVSGFVSKDGNAWTLVGKATLTIDSEALSGLVVTSIRRGVLNQSAFSNLGQ